MGTSSNRNSLTRPPTLPPKNTPDEDDGNEDESAEPEADGLPVSIPQPLRTAKSAITRGVRLSDNSDIRRGAREYVRASGGPARAARRLAPSARVAASILSMLQEFENGTPDNALATFQISDMAGEDAIDVLNALTDQICPDGGPIDESVARNSLTDAVMDMAEELGGIAFEDITPEQMEEFFLRFISNSIVYKIENEIVSENLLQTCSVHDIQRMEIVLRDFVRDSVRDQISASSKLPGTELQHRVNTIYRQALNVLLEWET